MTSTELAEKLDDQAATAALESPAAAKSLIEQVQDMSDSFAAALPNMLTPDRFLRQAVTMFRSTPELLECEPLTVKAGLMAAAQLGLEPGSTLGQFWLIPFKDNKRKTKVAQIVIGYPGYITLADRAGITISARPVFEGDEFEERAAPENELWHRPHSSSHDPAKLVATYAIASHTDGRSAYWVCYRDELDELAAKYGRHPGHPWKTNFVEMATKTPIRRIAKQLPMSAEQVVRATAFDSAIAQGIDARPDAAFDQITPIEIEEA